MAYLAQNQNQIASPPDFSFPVSHQDEPTTPHPTLPTQNKKPITNPFPSQDGRATRHDMAWHGMVSKQQRKKKKKQKQIPRPPPGPFACVG
jgi:hypothetical protein